MKRPNFTIRAIKNIAYLGALMLSTASQAAPVAASKKDSGIDKIMSVFTQLCGEDIDYRLMQQAMIDDGWDNYGNGEGTNLAIFTYLNERPDRRYNLRNVGTTTGTKVIDGLQAIFVFRQLNVDGVQSNECSIIIPKLGAAPKTEYLNALIGYSARTAYNLGVSRAGDRLWLWSQPETPNTIAIARWVDGKVSETNEAANQFAITTIRNKSSQ